MTRKILYISGTRADYGLMRSVLRKIHEHPELSLDIIVTGMHLMDEFGHTIDEVRADPYKYYIVDVRYESDTKESMATFIGKFIQSLTPVVSDLKPDIILILGDRGEMLAGAIVGAYLSIPVAHIHGGEVTSTIDDLARHAITKLSHLHFPATEESRERIIRMGEESERIFVTGAPGLDQILEEPLLSTKELAEKYHLDFSKPVILCVQHPVTLEVDDAHVQIRETLEAIASLQLQTIVIYPNADAGGRAMIKVIKGYETHSCIYACKSVIHRDYLSLLKNSSILIGNSSSGIIEAASFGIPVINIGTRQHGRQRGINVFDAGYDRNQIKNCIHFILGNESLRNELNKQLNPYGDGTSGEKITKVLNTIVIDTNLLDKSRNYSI